MPPAGPGDHPTDAEERERVALEHVTAAVSEEVAADHTPEEVEQAVEKAAQRYEGAAVRDFVPLLVEREVREDLRDTQ